jgi:hypothetical protein|tara:strand:- start:143 stop:370 length:228 start_codon:yes stop_codon:yes gene_type:complete
MSNLTTKRFVIRKSLIGKNVIITFTNKKNETYTYDHDAVYAANQEKFENMECFHKYGNYTNSNNLPTFARDYQVK